MPGAGRSASLPLPHFLPRRVRAAMVHAVSLADLAVTKRLASAADSLYPGLRRQGELEKLLPEISLLREEDRIKDLRMEQIEPHRRPSYPPAERLVILELRSAHGWSIAQTARTLLVSLLTIASWTGRPEEKEAESLFRLPVPENKIPDFVSYLVGRLKVLYQRLGKVRIVQVLARTGPHLGPTTVRRMLRKPQGPRPRLAPRAVP